MASRGRPGSGDHLILIRVLPPGPVSAGPHLRPARTTYRWRPLETVANRSAPMGCGPNVDQARPHAGAAALRVADLAWQGRPPPAAPDKRAPPATAFLGGALAGSGPGTSPCIDGLSLVSGMMNPHRPACSNHTHDVASEPTWHDCRKVKAARYQRRELTVRRLGSWDSTRFHLGPTSEVTHGRLLGPGVLLHPAVTARARSDPRVSAAVRTQRGPAVLGSFRAWTP
jgi:hypothetical protein